MMEQGEISFKSPSEWIWFWIMGNKKMCSFKRHLEISMTGLQQKYQNRNLKLPQPSYITFLVKHP